MGKSQQPLCESVFANLGIFSVEFAQVTSGSLCHPVSPVIAQTDVCIYRLINKVFVSGPGLLVCQCARQAHLLAGKQCKLINPSVSELIVSSTFL